MFWTRCLAFFVIFGICQGVKILVFTGTTSRSHVMGKGRLADSLAQVGHNVTVLAMNHGIDPFAFKFTNQRIVAIGRYDDESKAMRQEYQKELAKGAFHGFSIFTSYFATSKYSKYLKTGCEIALKENQEEIQQLKAEKFDAMFVGQMFPCGSALSHVLDIKIHFLYNSGPYMDHLAWLMGLPQPLGYVPTTCGLALSDKMSFGERILNTIESYFSMGYAENYDETNQLFQQFYGQDFPDVKNIIQKSPLVFTYVNRFIDFPRPIFAKDVYIGGLGMFDSSSEPLEEPFKSEIKKGKNGVVFFSLGSNTNTAYAPPNVIKNILNAFAEFSDYHFIVKLDKEDVNGTAFAKTKPNIFVANWAPQNQLLKHENLKLFITHGGYNSILETAQSGKPCLLIPLMFDQLRNAKVVEKNGWGKILPSTSLLETSAELVEQLNDLLTNPTYSTAAKRIKNLLETTPFSPQELLAKNVQFVLDNNGILPELEPASLQLSTIQQFNLDVFAFFFTIFVLSFGSLIIFTKFILKQLLKLSKSHHEKKTK